MAIFNEALSKAQSDLLVFLIIFCVFVILFGTMFYQYQNKKIKEMNTSTVMQLKLDLEKLKIESNNSVQESKNKNDAEANMFAKYSERENRILQIIEKNGHAQGQVAEALVKLSTVLDIGNKTCTECKLDQHNMWVEVIRKLDDTHSLLLLRPTKKTLKDTVVMSNEYVRSNSNV